jgi:hypothetical protein
VVSWLIGIGVVALLVLIGYFLVAWREEQDEVQEGRRPPEIEARIRFRDELSFGRLRRLRDELFFGRLRRRPPEIEAPIHYYDRPPRPYSPPRTPETHPQVERHELEQEQEILKDWEYGFSREKGPRRSWRISLETAPDVFVSHVGSSEWLNVFARAQRSGERIAEASGHWRRFGWNVYERRWSHDEGPPGSRELRRIMKEVF